FVAEGVVVHNSAEILLGDLNDKEFLSLKDPVLNQDKLNDWRWASNNSVFVESGSNYNQVSDSVVKNGEPGFFWLHNARNYGRMKDGYQEGVDALVSGTNPCFQGDTLIGVADGRGAVKIRDLA